MGSGNGACGVFYRDLYAIFLHSKYLLKLISFIFFLLGPIKILYRPSLVVKGNVLLGI